MSDLFPQGNNVNHLFMYKAGKKVSAKRSKVNHIYIVIYGNNIVFIQYIDWQVLHVHINHLSAGK